MSANLELNTIHNLDCRKGMEQLKPGSVDMVFADPPFNIGFEYDSYQDDKSYDDYLAWSWCWIGDVYKVLKSNGTFWLAIGDDFAAEMKIKAREWNFHCRSWVIWYYTFGVNCTNKFTRSHTHLFQFVKNPKEFTFNAEDIKVPSARQLIYKDKRAKPGGRIPDDTWILRPQDADMDSRPLDSAWHFPRVAGSHKERQGFHGCQMPELLLERIIKVSSNPGDLVLDPFSGSATTAAVAKKLGRQFVAFDISGDYVTKGLERLNQ